MFGYTMTADPDTSAKAIGKEMQISPKFTREICGMIRGMKVETAIETLEQVIDLKRAVPLRRYNKRVSHKPGVGPGRYPQKAATAVMGVIKSAMSNAEYKGLNTSDMVLTTITASRGQTIQGHMQRAHGRATQWNQETVNLEVIIEEVE